MELVCLWVTKKELTCTRHDWGAISCLLSTLLYARIGGRMCRWSWELDVPLCVDGPKLNDQSTKKTWQSPHSSSGLAELHRLMETSSTEIL